MPAINRMFLLSTLIVLGLIACAPSVEDCDEYFGSENLNKLYRQDKDASPYMEKACDKVWTMEDAKETEEEKAHKKLREKFPVMVGRYFEGSKTYYVRVNNTTREIHLDGGCPSDRIYDPELPSDWVLKKFYEMCPDYGEQGMNKSVPQRSNGTRP